MKLSTSGYARGTVGGLVFFVLLFDGIGSGINEYIVLIGAGFAA